jgi:hypothetical protein
MMLNNNLKRMWKDAAVVYLGISLVGGGLWTEENHENLLLQVRN